MRIIGNVIITWKKYKPKNGDKPTQCWNCPMYEHGGVQCHMSSACMICAESHHANACPFNVSEKRPAVFICFNCKKHGKDKTDHAANDVN